MRPKIFFRILGLLAVLVATSSVALSVVVVGQNRRLYQENQLEKAQILCGEIEPLLLWNDQVALRQALVRVVDTQRRIRYAFVERDGHVVAHSFLVGVPVGLIGVSRPARGPIIRELRDNRGKVFYDLVLSVGTDRSMLHLGLDRTLVDRAVIPAVTMLALIACALLLLLVYPVWKVAGTITGEIATMTARLEHANEALEARVAARTADLAAANARLSEEREKLAVTLRSIGDGVITAGVDGRVTLLNREAEELTGWRADDAVGRPLAEVFRIINRDSGKPLRVPLDEVLQAGSTVAVPNHTTLIAKDGAEHLIADSSAPIRDADSRIIGVVLVFRDVTENERLQAELQRAEKLESVGALAAGIAHDFNNLLMAILGNIELAVMDVDPSAPLSLDLKQAEQATLRAKDLAQRLLTFAKGNAPVKAANEIETIVREAASLAMSGSRARCSFSFQPGLPSVDVDAGQINQVIHNLLVNADQAMPNGGDIAVRCQAIVAEGQPGLPLVPGVYVRVCIEDYGMGISQKQLTRVFDPFFTTKPKGSGLGLAVVHSIMKHHGGDVTVASRVGQGTVFTLYLPTTGELPVPQEPVAGSIRAGKGRILIMDDEAMVRDVLGRMLERIGYRVDRAAHGHEAMVLCKRERGESERFALLVLDLTIPGGLGGRETLRRLRQEGIDTPAIASSGYASDPVMADPTAYGFAAAVPKPYSIVELCRAIDSVTSAQVAESTSSSAG